MIMAAAHSPLPVEQESEMSDARRMHPCPPIEMGKNTINPALVVILVAMAIFPFVVGFLPAPIVQHLDVLFH
jgi:hypothetical protein